jgi:glutaredoxin
MEIPPVQIILYRWAGSWGPFRIRIPCGECTLTKDVIRDTLEQELAGISVDLKLCDWLSCWWQPLLKGGWHAPIVLVDGKMISQGDALNRGILTEAVIRQHVKRTDLEGTQLFGKETCPHCQRAKELFTAAGIPFQYQDVIKNPRSLYEMLARVKPIVGPKTPVTVPQIWVDGKYVGGAAQLDAFLQCSVEIP